MVTAPFRWYGSKGSFYNRIYEVFPQSYIRYVEPFCGTCVVGINQPQLPKIEIYNDLDENVFTFMAVLSSKSSYKKLKSMLDVCCFSERLYEEAVEQLKDPTCDWVYRAFFFFVVNRMSYNGIGNFVVNTHIRRGMSKSVSDMLSTIDTLPEFHERLQRAVFLHRDALDVMEEFDTDNTLMYIDPPYVHDTRTGGRYKYEIDDDYHRKIVEFALKCKSYCVISAYKHDIYEDKLFRYDMKVVTNNPDHTHKVKWESVYINRELS